tara:strand:+ start:490 stop:1266 length:777 start_codon:yes stop_codon:yes gene_type:complete
VPTDFFKGRNMMHIDDFSTVELNHMLNLAANLKHVYKHDTTPGPKPKPLDSKSIASIFQKRSTRTRVSTETGAFLLGGHSLFLGPTDIQLGVNESMRDTANVLSNFNSVILARVFGHESVLELGKHSKVPVINALSDMHHPLQTLADLLTLEEHFGSREALRGKSVAWVGDGNNVLHDLMLGAAKLGMNVRIATPKGYEPNEEIIGWTNRIASEEGTEPVFLTNDASVAGERAKRASLFGRRECEPLLELTPYSTQIK